MFVVISGTLLLSAASAWAGDAAPGPAAEAGIVDKPDAQVPLDLQFTDDSGQPVKLSDYFHPNRPVLLVMVYFGCTQLCGPALNGVTEALRKVDLQPGRDFEIVTVSFKPEEEFEMAKLKKANFVKLLGKPEAAAGWHFLTSSDPAAARALGDAIGFGFRRNPATGQYMHATGIYFCTPAGRVSRVQRGIVYDPEIVRDSLIHASRGKISSGLFGVALSCGLVHFDERSGKYAWAAVTIVRITCITTFVLLASGIGWMVYRESRQKRAAGRREE